MIIRTIAIIALLGIGMSAAAQFTTVAPAYEIRLSDFRAPATPNGGATFKTCATCDTKRVRVTPDTRYSVNGRVVRFEKFRQAAQRIVDRDEATVVLKHDLASDTAISINVSVFGEHASQDD